jgi:hypothetical protein
LVPLAVSIANLAAAAPSAQSIARVEVSYASSDTPPIGATDWRLLRLPTPVSNGADPSAPIWYRLTFDLSTAPMGTWAIFARRAEERIAFFNDSKMTPVADDRSHPRRAGTTLDFSKWERNGCMPGATSFTRACVRRASANTSFRSWDRRLSC